jgi:hypothetical protein
MVLHQHRIEGFVIHRVHKVSVAAVIIHVSSVLMPLIFGDSNGNIPPVNPVKGCEVQDTLTYHVLTTPAADMLRSGKASAGRERRSARILDPTERSGRK